MNPEQQPSRPEEAEVQETPVEKAKKTIEQLEDADLSTIAETKEVSVGLLPTSESADESFDTEEFVKLVLEEIEKRKEKVE